jgi:pimeloyl-ACP methyl ester carboxylesterase
MYILSLFLAALLLPGLAVAQQQVSFSTQDGGVVHADVYGSGDRGLVLAHGGRFTKDSWTEQMPAFLNAGFRVLAIDFRGRGQSRGPQLNPVKKAQSTTFWPLYVTSAKLAPRR